MRDLENQMLFEHIQSFAQKMRAMREYLTQAGKRYYTYQKERWFLDAVKMYCDAVTGLLHDLSLVDLQSRGFLAFREDVTDYANSDRFTSLLAETKKLKADLSAVKYCLLIRGNGIKVRTYESEIDYSADVEETFAKFRIFVVTGPNQGGKTTFARTFGQVHYLASLGCPVPGREAHLFLFDRLFTHFEKEETIKDLRGKLQDDLVRLYTILHQATSNSMIIMREQLHPS